jgi:hypothetical protein
MVVRTIIKESFSTKILEKSCCGRVIEEGCRGRASIQDTQGNAGEKLINKVIDRQNFYRREKREMHNVSYVFISSVPCSRY